MTDRGQQEPDTPPRISTGAAADEPDEMELISKVDHDLDDAVIRGETGVLPAGLLPVAQVVASLRERAAAEPVPPMSDALRAQLTTPNVVAIRAARSMRRAVAVAAAAVASVAFVGVGAAQNRLPSQLQDVVASTAELVGIDVPRSDERGASRSDEGLEHGRDDTAPNRLGDVEPGADGPTPGGAIPAVPGGPDGPATPATPPDQAASPEKPENPEKPEKPEKPEAPETPAQPPADPVTPEGPPGQDEGAPPSNPQGSSAGGGSSTTPPSHPNGADNNAGGVAGTTPASSAGKGK